MHLATTGQQSDQVLPGLGAQFDTSPIKISSELQDMNKDLQQIVADSKKDNLQASTEAARKAGRN
jgi:hypothetical protein